MILQINELTKGVIRYLQRNGNVEFSFIYPQMMNITVPFTKRWSIWKLQSRWKTFHSSAIERTRWGVSLSKNGSFLYNLVNFFGNFKFAPSFTRSLAPHTNRSPTNKREMECAKVVVAARLVSKPDGRSVLRSVEDRIKQRLTGLLSLAGLPPPKTSIHLAA